MNANSFLLPRLVYCTGLAIALTHAPATAQNRLFVPGQFAQIGAAVQAATPGTIIEVQWQATAYQPFVVDRPVTIVGFAQEQMAPLVAVPSNGVGIDCRLAAGQHATLSRIDVAPVSGTGPSTGVRIRGGSISVEDCRINSGGDPTGSVGGATIYVIDADLRLAFSRITSGPGVVGLRAVRARVSATKTSFAGGSLVAGDGVRLRDSLLHGHDCWLFGGEDFRGGAGMPALRAVGASRAWLVDCLARGGIGTPGGVGIVNATSTPIELLRTTPAGGTHWTNGSVAASAIGPMLGNPNLLGLAWSEPPYRRGTLQPGNQWTVRTIGPPNAPALLVLSFGPIATSTAWTRQPALRLQDIAVALPLVLSPSGDGVFQASVPNTRSLVGVGLWAQAVAGTSLPLEASPLSGVVVR